MVYVIGYHYETLPGSKLTFGMSRGYLLGSKLLESKLPRNLDHCVDASRVPISALGLTRPATTRYARTRSGAWPTVRLYYATLQHVIKRPCASDTEVN